MKGFIPYKTSFQILALLVCVAVGLVLFNAITQNDDLKNLTVLVKDTKSQVNVLAGQTDYLVKNAVSKQDLTVLQEKIDSAPSRADIERLEQKVDSLNLPSNITNNLFSYVFNINFLISIGLALVSLELIQLALVSIDAKFRWKFVGKIKLKYWYFVNNETKISQTISNYKLDLQETSAKNK